MNDPDLQELCKGVYTLQAISPTQPLWQLLLQVGLGAVSAIGGGYAAVIARLRLEKKQEIEYIKTGIIDELHEFCTIIDKMVETQSTTNIIPPTYFNDLTANREAFDRNRERLFLIDDAPLRKAIVSFYKKIETEAAKARDTVGTLAPGANETAAVIRTFNAIKTEAQTLENQIRAYKFKTLGFI